jgi:hypothetical protein
MCANSGHFLKKCAKAKTKLVLKHFNYIGHSLVFYLSFSIIILISIILSLQAPVARFQHTT